MLTSTAAPSFDRVASFLIANPGWPNEAQLRAKAEAALESSGFVPASAVAYFERFAPTTGVGQLQYAQALLAAGRNREAGDMARRAWTTGTLNPMQETRLLTNFSNSLTQADHDARMDRLLWTVGASDAARQMSYVSANRRSEFAARLAFRGEDPAAAMRASDAERADPSITTTNAGYIWNKARWLRASGQRNAAQQLLAQRRNLAAAPTVPATWLELLVTTAREARSAGDSRGAFAIASQVDDALPRGAVVIEQSLPVRDQYTNAVWLAADTAYRQLNNPREAARLFALYSTGGRSPTVKARGLYWAGRAAQDAGDRNGANGYYQQAGAHFDNFHGQLALERLGTPQPRPQAPEGVRFSNNERDAFYRNSVVSAARLLGQQGDHQTQSLFLRTIANNATSDADHYFASQLSQDIGRPDLAVMVGRSAKTNGLDDYVPTAFPTVNVPSGYEDRWTFIHAIARQESQFDRAAVSHAGARGLMQLMPGTARDTARRLGLSYDMNALTNDPSYNIRLGSTYFQQMLNYYGGSYPLAVAAYNAGPGNVNRWLTANGDPRQGADILAWIEAIPFSETRGYVQRVLENAVVYETIRPGASGAQNAPLSRLLGKSRPG